MGTRNLSLAVAFVIFASGLPMRQGRQNWELGELRAGNQHFVERPKNRTVREGEDILLECRVGNLQGKVQWTRKGFAMGYSDEQVKRICPRCQLIPKPESGQFNLLVRSVRLGEDETFECQVLPGETAVVKRPLRASVHIDIQVPPNRVTLENPPTRLAGETLPLICAAHDANPQASILWFKDNQPILDAETSENVYPGDRNGTFTTVSKISVKTDASDDGAAVSCLAEHAAIEDPQHAELLKDRKRITVQYPPSVPELTGDFERKKRLGDVISLQCLSRGGNPLPKITWIKNGRAIDRATAHSAVTTETSEDLKTTKSTIRINASRSDHEAVYSCSVFSNPKVMTAPVESPRGSKFNVTFPPRRVVIEGPTQARTEESLKFRCLAEDANPAPHINWVVNGQRANSAAVTTSQPSPELSLGWTVSSELRWAVGVNDTRIAVSCRAVSEGHFGQALVEKDDREIIVLRPPSSPVVTGLPQNQTLREGQKLELVCSSMDGSPKPHLKWFLGNGRDNEVKAAAADFTQNPFPKSKITLKVVREDNVRDYRCESSNSANEKRPAATVIRFGVFFAPKSLRIELERPEGKASHDQWDRTATFKASKKFKDDSYRIVTAGELIRLVCVSGSSKPRPLLHWTDNGLRKEANRTEFRPAEHGGEELRSVIEFRAEPYHNERVYECFAHNPTILTQGELRAKISLIVLYKPIFPEEALGVYTVVEGDSKNISLNAVANPPEISYKWIFPAAAADGNRVVQRKSLLTVVKADREDAGNYTVTASNSYGDFNTTVSVLLDVLYPPVIKHISDGQTAVEKKERAVFTCKIEANPFREDTIQWDLPDHPGGPNAWKNKKEVNVDLKNKTSTLILHFPRREERGRVECRASNGVRGIVDKQYSFLVINHAPSIVKDDNRFGRYAIPRGNPAFLVCRTFAVPQADFSWRISTTIKSSESANALTTTKDIDPEDPSGGETVLEPRPVPGHPTAMDSILKLDNVRTEHYATEFRCAASNLYGGDEHVIVLQAPGIPDKPTNVSVTTRPTAILLEWTPGFDGGHNQTYAIELLDQKTGDHIRGYDLDRAEAAMNGTIVSDLKPHTSYIIRVWSKNKAGLSKSFEEVFVKTRALQNVIEEEEVLPRAIIIAIVLVVILGVVFVFVVVGCCCCRIGRRRRSKAMTKNDTSANDKYKKPKKTTTSASNRLLLGRSNSNKSLIVERYTPAKYNNALFYSPSSFENSIFPPRSSSTSSSAKMDYRELARSLTVPGRRRTISNIDLDLGDDIDDDSVGENDCPRRQLPHVQSRRSFLCYGALPNGDIAHNHNQYRCSSRIDDHQTQRRQSQRLSSIGCNTTLEDDVFMESQQAAHPSMTRTFKYSEPAGVTNQHQHNKMIGSRLASSGNDSGYFAPPPNRRLTTLTRSNNPNSTTTSSSSNQTASVHVAFANNGSNNYHLPMPPKFCLPLQDIHQRHQESEVDVSSSNASAPSSPMKHFSFLSTSSLPRRRQSPYFIQAGIRRQQKQHLDPNDLLIQPQPPNGDIVTNTLGRTRRTQSPHVKTTSFSTTVRKASSDDRLSAATSTRLLESPPLPCPPPPPPPPISSFRHLKFETKPSLIV